jgi:hypothetical protein
MQRENQRFRGIGSDGRVYHFAEYGSRISTGSSAGPGATTEGFPSFQLATGGHINKLSDLEFQILKTGVKVRVER